MRSHDPEVWGERAFQRFCTPCFSRYRRPDHDLLVKRARFHLRNAVTTRVATAEGELQAYVFEPEAAWNGASVLLVHGWTGEASFMTAFAEHFRKRGFRVVLFDFPAHGRSMRERASLIDCAHAVRQVAESLGPIQFALAHSLGGMAALLAGGGRPPMPHAPRFSASCWSPCPITSQW
jgi:alpha-beta hydrolase superfamily lysophospholipase